jgi:formate hydrogenlyase transcriptional activator
MIPQLCAVLAPDGQALYVNQSTLEYTGLTEDQANGFEFRQRVFHPDDIERLRETRTLGLARGVLFENEQRARRHDGQYRWFLIQYRPLRDEHGHVLRWYATGTDIDDRKRAEEQIHNENLALREEIDRLSMFEEIVGSSMPLRRVLTLVEKVAATDSTVLITGETGSGKELVARAIHKKSHRAARAFIRVNCGAIPSSLVASELFGHEKGAFTGALQRRLGRFESANGGTILLDEIGDLPADTQIALLRVLQDREIERVGNSHPIPVDVRVLAATNRDLDDAVTAGTFRQDLFYRLNVFPIHVPSLRERADDIPLLVGYLIERYARKAGKRIRKISRSALTLFQAYDWPGNIRELQNVIERAVILCDGDTFSVDETWLTRDSRTAAGPSIPIGSSLPQQHRHQSDTERQMIEAALAATRGRIAGPNGAAAKLGIPRQTLDSKITALGIDKHRFKSRPPSLKLRRTS